MATIDTIIDASIEGIEPVSQILRRCLVLAHNLDNSALKSWAEQELNGYANADDLPSYRKATAVALGVFMDGIGRVISDQPLNAGALNPEHRHWAKTLNLKQPIAAYEGIDKSQSGIIQWPADLVALYQDKFMDGMWLNRAWQVVPGSVMTALIDTVRTRILTFALEIRREIPENTPDREISSKVPDDFVNHIVNVTIFGGNNVVGSHTKFNSTTVEAGSLTSLKIALAEEGVNELEFAELEKSIAADRSDNVTKGMGARTVSWIKKTTKKLGDIGVKTSSAVAEDVIKRLVLDYLGLSS
jgi:hypothetical protein